MNIHRETRAAQPDQQKYLKLSRLKGGVPRRGEGVSHKPRVTPDLRETPPARDPLGLRPLPLSGGRTEIPAAQPKAVCQPSGALQSLQISAAEVPARYKGFNFRRRGQPPVTKPPISAVGADRTLQSPRFPAADATARYKGANPPRRRFCNPLRSLKRNSIHF